MNFLRRRRLPLLLAAGCVVLFGLGRTVGLAASSNDTTDHLGGSTVAVAACSTAAITAAYTTTTTTSTLFEISAVVFTGLPSPACNSMPYRMQLYGANHAAEGSEVTGTTPASPTTTFTATLGTAVASDQVEGVSLVISTH